MPLDRSTTIKPPSWTVGFGRYDQPDPSFLDSISAAYRQENIIGSAFTRYQNAVEFDDSDTPDENYNVYRDPDMRDIIAKYPDRFETVYNRNAALATRQRIEQEEKDRQTLAASGWTGIALSMLASVTDLPTLIPGGVLARSGVGGLKLIGASAGIAGAGTTVQEAGLLATQELRTPKESAKSIAAATALGGLLGGSVVLGGLIGSTASRFLSKQEWDKLSYSLEQELADEVPDTIALADTLSKRMQSAGAASVDQVDLSDLGVGGGRAAQAVANATAAARINPGLQTMLSPSVKVRETYNKLVDNPLYTTMNMEGRTLGPAVENFVKQYQRGALASWLDESRQLYREAKKTGYSGTKREFYEAIARAGRRGDVDVNGNEFITRAAQEARTKVFDPLLERAKAIGLLPEDVKTTTAASYVTRLWNRQKLIGEEDRFREIATKYFREQLGKLPEGEGPDFVSKADMEDYVQQVVTGVFNNLTGRGKGDIPEWIVPVTRGPLKERTFNIPDELVEDFLENDMEAILRRYSRTMGAEVELAQKFGRADMKDQFEAINREYDDLSAKAKTPGERKKLNKARERDITNLTAFRDMIRGTYRAADNASDWSKITRAAMTWNYIRLLGGVTLTSLTDAASIIGKFGMRAAMTEPAMALAAKLKGSNAYRISTKDARDLGVVVDRVLQSRLANLAELTDPYAYGSRFERFLANTSNIFSRATGLGYWNDTMRTIAAVMSQNRTARILLKGAGSKQDRALIAMLGIDDEMGQRIAGQLRRHGIEEDGIFGANVEAWDDGLAARTWAAALNKDVDRTIIMKGAADNPLMMKSNIGSLLLQFKSFALAAHQRVLIAGLQERPHRLAEQLVFGTVLGMLVSYLKYVERGDFDEANRLLENPGLWIANGVDRSGIASIPFEISNTMEKLGAPGFVSAAQAIAGDEDRGGSASRYASRGPWGALLGPSGGIVEDWVTIANQLGSGDLKKSGVNAMIRQLPGSTLPGVRTAIHVGVKPALSDAVE